MRHCAPTSLYRVYGNAAGAMVLFWHAPKSDHVDIGDGLDWWNSVTRQHAATILKTGAYRLEAKRSRTDGGAA